MRKPCCWQGSLTHSPFAYGTLMKLEQIEWCGRTCFARTTNFFKDANSVTNGDSGKQGANLISQIEAMAEPLGRGVYRGILKTVARVWQPTQNTDSALLKNTWSPGLPGTRELFHGHLTLKAQISWVPMSRVKTGEPSAVLERHLWEEGRLASEYRTTRALEV